MRGCIVLLLIAVLVVPVLAQEGDPAGAAYRRGYDHVLDEDWEAAITAFEELQRSFPESGWVDDAGFWICYAREQSRLTLVEAFDCYESFLDRHPRSEWADDAKRNLIRLADRLAKEGRPGYRDRVKGYGQSDDPESILAILVALAEIGDERAIEVVLEKYRETENVELRGKIVRVLGEIESERMGPVLLDIIANDPSERVRAEAVWAYQEAKEGEAGEELMRIAADPEQPHDVRENAISALGSYPRPGVEKFLLDLALSADRRLAVEAVDALRDHEGGSLEPLIEVYRRSTDREVREKAVYAMGDSRTKEALEFLTGIARKESDPELVEEAVDAIGEFESAAAFAILRELARGEKSWETRASAVSAIGDYESSEAVTVLAAIYKGESDPRVREAIVWGLEDTELDDAVDVLYEIARSDSDRQVRISATDALGDLGTTRAREKLIELLGKGN